MSTAFKLRQMRTYRVRQIVLAWIFRDRRMLAYHRTMLQRLNAIAKLERKTRPR